MQACACNSDSLGEVEKQWKKKDDRGINSLHAAV
jgi:hypothetical protein